MTNQAMNDADLDYEGIETSLENIYLIKNLQTQVKEKIDCIKNVLERLNNPGKEI